MFLKRAAILFTAASLLFSPAVRASDSGAEPAEDISTLLSREIEKPDTSRGFPFYNNPKKPAPMGIWLKAYRLSYSDSDDHVVYFRVRSVSDTDTSSDDIKEFNKKSPNGIIGELDDPYLGYKIIEYDVYYPEDFYVGDEGCVVDPTLAFSISNPAGGGFVTERGAYVGLSKVQPLEVVRTEGGAPSDGEDAGDDGKIRPGDVYHGKSVFAMLNEVGEDEYVLQYACRQSEPDGQVIYQYSSMLQ